MQPPPLPDKLFAPDACVDQDLYCLHCGYNLRTLAVESVCPECGLAVELSMMEPGEVEWLRVVRRGVSWALVAAWGAAGLSALYYSLLWGASVSYYPFLAWFRLLWLPLLFMNMWAVFKITKRSEFVVGSGMRNLRSATRALAVLSLVLGLVQQCAVGLFMLAGGRNVLPLYAVAALVNAAGDLALVAYLYLLLAARHTKLRTLVLSYSLVRVVSVVLLATSITLQYRAYSVSGGLSFNSPQSAALEHDLRTLWAVIHIAGMLLWLVFLVRCRKTLRGIVSSGPTESAATAAV